MDGKIKGTILVVDEDESIRKALTAALSVEGYDVTSSASALDAIIKLSKIKFDLAIMDILIPELSGFDLLKIMKKACPETLQIVLTALKDPQEQFSRTAAYSEVIAFLPKPFQINDLSQAVQNAMIHKQELAKVRQLALQGK